MSFIKDGVRLNVAEMVLGLFEREPANIEEAETVLKVGGASNRQITTFMNLSILDILRGITVKDIFAIAKTINDRPRPSEMFKELVRLGDRFRNTAPVDDDYPQIRDEFDRALQAAKESLT